MRVKHWQIYVLAGLSLLLGVVGATGAHLYQRHNEQHWQMEQALRQQELINREFAQALNALIQRK